MDLADSAVRTGQDREPPGDARGSGGAQALEQDKTSSTTENLCFDPTMTAVFCSAPDMGGAVPWHSVGGGYATAAFYKINSASCTSEDSFRTPSSPRTRRFRGRFSACPPGYRPASRRAFASVGSVSSEGRQVAPARVDVGPNGLLELVTDCDASASNCSATGKYVTLDGISYRPDE